MHTLEKFVQLLCCPSPLRHTGLENRLRSLHPAC